MYNGWMNARRMMRPPMMQNARAMPMPSAGLPNPMNLPSMPGIQRMPQGLPGAMPAGMMQRPPQSFGGMQPMPQQMPQPMGQQMGPQVASLQPPPPGTPTHGGTNMPMMGGGLMGQPMPMGGAATNMPMMGGLMPPQAPQGGLMPQAQPGMPQATQQPQAMPQAAMTTFRPQPGRMLR